MKSTWKIYTEMDPEEAVYDVQFGQYCVSNNKVYRLTSVLLVSILLDLYIAEKE